MSFSTSPLNQKALLNPPQLKTLHEYYAWSKSDPKKRHTVKRPEGHILRAPNEFLIFRSNYCKTCVAPGAQQALVSKEISVAWRLLPGEIREKYTRIAKDLQDDHKRLHPEYAYQPDKTRMKAKRKGHAAVDDDETMEKSAEKIEALLGTDKQTAKATWMEKAKKLSTALTSPKSSKQKKQPASAPARRTRAPARSRYVDCTDSEPESEDSDYVPSPRITRSTRARNAVTSCSPTPTAYNPGATIAALKYPAMDPVKKEESPELLYPFSSPEVEMADAFGPLSPTSTIAPASPDYDMLHDVSPMDSRDYLRYLHEDFEQLIDLTQCESDDDVEEVVQDYFSRRARAMSPTAGRESAATHTEAPTAGPSSPDLSYLDSDFLGIRVKSSRIPDERYRSNTFGMQINDQHSRFLSLYSGSLNNPTQQARR